MDPGVKQLESAMKKENTLLPPPFEAICFSTDCSDTGKCAKAGVLRRCHLRPSFLNDVIAGLDELKNNALVVTDNNIPAEAMLQDIAGSGYFTTFTSGVNKYIKKTRDQQRYVDRLGLLYFVVKAHSKLRFTFPREEVEKIMNTPVPLFAKLAMYDALYANMTDGGKVAAGIVFGMIALAGLAYAHNSYEQTRISQEEEIERLISQKEEIERLISQEEEIERPKNCPINRATDFAEWTVDKATGFGSRLGNTINYTGDWAYNKSPELLQNTWEASKDFAKGMYNAASLLPYIVTGQKKTYFGGGV